MEIFIGTSGWMYSWNPDGFRWYIDNSGLNSVELNMSFYRFPYPNQVKGWRRYSGETGLRWSVKVHRLITHTHLLAGKAYRYMDGFLELFKPLDDYIDFYLLQLPPRFRFRGEYMDRVRDFTSTLGLKWRIAVEFRDRGWFNDRIVRFAGENLFTFVSVDSPETIFYARSGPYIYIRFHGRSSWYSHNYTYGELYDAALKLRDLGGDKLYAYFNNDHDMLGNARLFKEIAWRLFLGDR